MSGLPGPITQPLVAVEPNVLIAGVEGTAAMAAVRWAFTGTPIALPDEWKWWYVVAGVFILVLLVLIGLAVEGLGMLVEWLVTKRWWGDERGKLREWYRRWTAVPKSWGAGQRWMWSSPQASQEFARRRLRLLIARNTWSLIGLTLPLVMIGLPIGEPPSWRGYMLFGTPACLLAGALFFWIWIRAHYGWNKAVRDAGSL